VSEVGGTVASGFERVSDRFRANVGAFGEGGGALAVFIDGKLVVDLWAGRAAPGQPWREDTLEVLMSSTKGMAALCAVMLADRGELDVDAPVCEYWPEFAQNGKQRVLVRHVLTHTAGVVGFGDGRPPLGWDGSGWDDYDAIAAALAAAPLCWSPGERFGYHALTFGWLIGELVRRITGRTVGTMFRVEVAEPLGLDLRIGTPPADQPRVARVIDATAASVPRPLRMILGSVQRQMRDPRTLAGQAFLADGESCLMDHAEAFFADGAGAGCRGPRRQRHGYGAQPGQDVRGAVRRWRARRRPPPQPGIGAQVRGRSDSHARRHAQPSCVPGSSDVCSRALSGAALASSSTRRCRESPIASVRTPPPSATTAQAARSPSAISTAAWPSDSSATR